MNPLLSITVETMDQAIEVPIASGTAFQVRNDGVYIDGALYLWEQVIAVMIVNKNVGK